MPTTDTPSATRGEPTTEAGRRLLMGDSVQGSYRIPHLDTCIWWKVGGQCDGDCGVLPIILAIEAEARASSPPPLTALQEVRDTLAALSLPLGSSREAAQHERDTAIALIDAALTRRINPALDVLHAIMDTGFRSGDRYVGADELAFIFGRPFEFTNEDGSTTTFDGSGSWLNDYPYPDNDIGIAIARLSELDTRTP